MVGFVLGQTERQLEIKEVVQPGVAKIGVDTFSRCAFEVLRPDDFFRIVKAAEVAGDVVLVVVKLLTNVLVDRGVDKGFVEEWKHELADEVGNVNNIDEIDEGRGLSLSVVIVKGHPCERRQGAG